MPEGITVTFTESELAKAANSLELLSKHGPTVFRRALNHEGDKGHTQAVNDLTAQTGLPKRTIGRAVKPLRANYTSLTYILRTRGGEVALKYFRPRETRSGVSAMPHGARELFEGTFIKGGVFSGKRFGDITSSVTHRVSLNLGGQVFKRVSDARLPIVKQRSGVVIPKEMVTGRTATNFRRLAGGGLQQRVEHELAAILAGHVRP